MPEENAVSFAGDHLDKTSSREASERTGYVAELRGRFAVLDLSREEEGEQEDEDAYRDSSLLIRRDRQSGGLYNREAAREIRVLLCLVSQTREKYIFPGNYSAM